MEAAILVVIMIAGFTYSAIKTKKVGRTAANGH